MSNKTRSGKPDAVRTHISWGRHAVDLLRGRGVDFDQPTGELTRKLDAMVASRAYTESQDKPKIQLRYEYPIELLLANAGGPHGDTFERALPSAIEIVKLFIPFPDGSVFMVCTPTEATVQCANYVELLRSNPALAKMVGADQARLDALAELVELAHGNPRAMGVGKADVEQMLSREAAVAKRGASPSVWVNLSERKIRGQQAVALLREFFLSPSDTVTASVAQFLEREFQGRPSQSSGGAAA